MQDQLLIYTSVASRSPWRRHAEAAALISFTVLVLYAARNPALTVLVNKLVVPGAAVATIAYGRFRLLLTREQLFFAAFTLYGSIGILYTSETAPVMRYLQILGGILLLWLPVGYFVGQRGHFKALMAGFALSAGILLYGAVSATGSIITGADSMTQLTGDITNPNGLAFVLLYGVMACVYLASRSEAPVYRVALLLMSVLLAAGVVGTASRKTLIAALLFIGVYSIWRRTTWKRALVIVMVLVIALLSFENIVDLLAEETYVGRRFQAEQLERASETRGGLVLDALGVFAQSPLFGVGLGNYQFYSAYGLYSHNDIAELLSTTGLLGAALYLGMYLVFIQRLRRLKRVENAVVRKEVAFLRAAFIASMFLGFGRVTFVDLFGMFFLAVLFSHAYHLSRITGLEWAR